MILNLLIAFFIFLMSYLSFYFKKLSLHGAIWGGLLASCIYIGIGFTGLLLLGFFFFSASIVTSWKFDDKTKLGFAEKEQGRRNSSQVLANGGIAGLCGLSGYLFSESAWLFELMLAGSLSAAIADTFASELGVIYGKQHYQILTGKKGKRGDNGVISLEGTLAGVVGSLSLSAFFILMRGVGNHFYWIILAGIAGNFIDSVLGAIFENSGLISNDVVNVLNTLSGALTIGILYFTLS